MFLAGVCYVWSLLNMARGYECPWATGTGASLSFPTFADDAARFFVVGDHQIGFNLLLHFFHV